MIRRLLLAGVAATAALVLAACGEKSEPTAEGVRSQRLTVMLDYFPNADHAGIYEARADGEFKRAGLEVRLQTPSDPAAPLKLLAAGKVDVAISYEPELLLARDQGLDLVSVGALIQRPLTSLMAIGGTRLTSPADLAGLTVGTAGIPYQEAYLKTILRKAGVDATSVKRVDVGFNLVPAMLSRRVDATLGAFWNYEGVQLTRRKKDPSIIRIDQAGVPTYNELVLVVRRDTARARGPMLRRFLQALARGHRALRRDPTGSIDALLKANPDLDAGLQRAVVKATLPSFFPADARRPFGWQSVTQWTTYANWMYENRLIKRRPQVRRALTNEYLPGQGV